MISRLYKYNDKLNPILVKEVIQGMRTKVFTGAFLITQVVLFLMTLTAIGSDSGNSEDSSSLFWISISMPLILIMPMRGLSAIHAEVKSNTLEMLFLSNLSSRQIMRGKFFSLAVQILLLASTVLPYMVFRYFAGEIDLLQEVIAFGVIIVLGLFVAAASVSVSAFSHKNPVSHMFRVGLIVFVAIQFYFVLLTMTMSFLFSGGGLSSIDFNLVDFIAVSLQAVLLLDFILVLGSTQISPRDENLWPTKRLHCLCQLIIYSIAHQFTDNAWIIGAPIACLVLSALEGLFTADNPLKASYKKAQRFKLFDMTFCQEMISAATWFNFAIITVTSLIAIEALVQSSGDNSFTLIPFVIGMLYLLIVNGVNKICNSNLLTASIIWLPFPALIVIAYSNFNLDRDTSVAITIALAIYSCIVIPWAAVKTLEVMRQKQLPFIFTIISYAVFFIGCSIMIFCRETRLIGDVNLTPLDLFGMTSEFRRNEFIAGSIIYGEIALALVVIIILTTRSSKRYRKTRALFLQDQESKGHQPAA